MVTDFLWSESSEAPNKYNRLRESRSCNLGRASLGISLVQCFLDIVWELVKVSPELIVTLSMNVTVVEASLCWLMFSKTRSDFISPVYWCSLSNLYLSLRCSPGTTSTTRGWRRGSRTRGTQSRTPRTSSRTWWVSAVNFCLTKV